MGWTCFEIRGHLRQELPRHRSKENHVAIEAHKKSEEYWCYKGEFGYTRGIMSTDRG